MTTRIWTCRIDRRSPHLYREWEWLEHPGGRRQLMFEFVIYGRRRRHQLAPLCPLYFKSPHWFP